MSGEGWRTRVASHVPPQSCECHGTSDWAEPGAADRAGPDVAAATEAWMVARIRANASAQARGVWSVLTPGGGGG